MYGQKTAASITAAGVIGVMAAAGLAPAQAAQAAAPVRVPCDPAALAAAVAGAASGTTLELAHRCDYILTAALPTITGDLTINGREATLERSDSPGTPAFAILSMNGAGDSGITATINRLNFRNGNHAIYVTGLGSIAVTGGTFTANTAPDGGAIDIDNTGIDSQVSDATFTGDTATTGSGGAISDNSPSSGLNLDHNRFTGNHAAGEGGAVFDIGAGGQITDSTFRGNAAAFGGAIFTSQDAGEGLTGLVVHGNSATGDGGGIYGDGDGIENSKITGNHAGGNGGGIYENPSNGGGGPPEISGTFIEGNAAANGGGIYEDAGLTLTDSTISRNHATADGGGIDSVGVLNAGSTQITGNRAVAGGGGIYDDGPAAATTLTNSPVTGNKPDNCEPTATITGCTS
jgi:predicted outer membrane repeat protein